MQPAQPAALAPYMAARDMLAEHLNGSRCDVQHELELDTHHTCAIAWLVGILQRAGIHVIRLCQ